MRQVTKTYTRDNSKSYSYFGFRRTRITESPRKKSLLMKRSLFTGFAFFLPPWGTSVHISRTFSKTMFEWRSKALTRARIFLLLRQLISTWELSFTHFCNTDKGPTSKLSFSSGLASSAMAPDAAAGRRLATAAWGGAEPAEGGGLGP